MKVDDSFDDQDDIALPLAYRHWRAELEEVLDTYVREVENYRRELRTLTKQLNSVMTIVTSLQKEKE